jgi:hypothetical protein
VTGDDDLRARLAGIDPVSRVGAVDPLPTPTTAEIAEIVEHIMQTVNHTPATPERRTPTSWRRTGLLAAAAVTAAAAVGVGGFLAPWGGEPTAQPSATLALSSAPSDVMGSCAVFDVEVLRRMPVAFAGTATAVDPDVVTLRVDRWYTGGSAQQVTVTVPAGQRSVALDGVEFVDGQQYLVTATDGMVNGCGLSGPRSPELERAFAEAFGG